MGMRLGLSAGVVACAACVCSGAHVVFQASITRAQYTEASASRLEPGHYAGLSVLFVEMVATAFDVDEKQVTIDPGFRRSLEAYDIVVSVDGADETAMRETIQAVIGGAFQCGFEVAPDVKMSRVLQIEDATKLTPSTGAARDFRLAFKGHNRADMRFDFSAHRMTLSNLADTMGDMLRLETQVQVREDHGFEYDFECLDCNEAEFLQYLRRDHGLIIMAIEEPTRSVRVVARNSDTPLE